MPKNFESEAAVSSLKIEKNLNDKNNFSLIKTLVKKNDKFLP